MRAHHKHFVPPEPLPLFETYFPTTWVNPPMQAVDTSREAASRIAGRAPRLRAAIYLWLRTQEHGATCREIATALGLLENTCRPRLRELEGTAPWAEGKLPRLIQRLATRRNGMRVYEAI